jgi:hypothetical protein
VDRLVPVRSSGPYAGSEFAMSELETPGPVNDPIASLHRMSTTAGVGSTDYVAINTLAIVSAVLGLVTGLAYFGAPFMLIGLAAIICGVVALRQISDSNGTQGGKGVAWMGIGLSLLMAGGAFAIDRIHAAQQCRHEQTINQLILHLGDLVRATKYPEAYELFDDAFKNQFPLATFESQWKIYQDPGGAGPLQEFEGNGIFDFSSFEGGQGAVTEVKVRFTKYATRELRWRMSFTFRPDRGWKVLSMPDMFDPQSLRKKR